MPTKRWAAQRVKPISHHRRRAIAGCGNSCTFRTEPRSHAVKSSSHKFQPRLIFLPMQRTDGRAPDEIRSLNFELNVAPYASGSVLVSMGKTRVICGVTIEEAVPRWMKEQGVTGGWLTAEYSMLPYSTNTRKQRDIAKGRLNGRSTEIQRLIGQVGR